MRPELRKEMLRILEQSSDGKMIVLTLGDDILTHEAVRLLESHGALDTYRSSNRITVTGYDYYQELKSPRFYWLRQNWFPVAVLVVTSLVSLIGNLISVWLD